MKEVLFRAAVIIAAPFIVFWFNLTHPKAFMKAWREHFADKQE